jgi:hypothetical protein
MTQSARTERHRTQAARRGLRRVEVTIPSDDVSRMRRLAATMREGGEAAERLRTAVDAAVGRRETARDIFDRVLVHVPPGEPLDYGRDDLAPDRDIDL